MADLLSWVVFPCVTHLGIWVGIALEIEMVLYHLQTIFYRAQTRSQLCLRIYNGKKNWRNRIDYLCWSSVHLFTVFNYICLGSHWKSRAALGDLWSKAFAFLSHSSCSPTAVLLLPWCPHAQVSRSSDVPPPQASCWGFLVGLGVDQSLAYSSLGDEPGATFSFCHSGTGDLTAGLFVRSEWHHLLPSSCVFRGTDCP